MKERRNANTIGQRSRENGKERGEKSIVFQDAIVS